MSHEGVRPPLDCQIHQCPLSNTPGVLLIGPIPKSLSNRISSLLLLLLLLQDEKVALASGRYETDSALAVERPARGLLCRAIMASSIFPTSHYSGEEFVESCGAVLFDLTGSEASVCLVHYLPKNEWMLAKGRRNCGEDRHAAAMREIREETGHCCELLPITMPTRAPAAEEEANVADVARCYSNIAEPFMVTTREMNGGAHIKIIWWYIAKLNGLESPRKVETQFAPQFFPIYDAVQKLTFEGDRKILNRAIELLSKQSWWEYD